MMLTLAVTLGLALSTPAQAPAAGATAPAAPAVATPQQPQQPAATEPKPAGTTGAKPVDPITVAPQPAQTTPDPAVTSRNAETVVLLQRMESLLSHAQTDEGHLKTAGKVELDRSDLDEVIAEIKQLKVMLQK